VRDLTGIVILTWHGPRGMKRPCQKLPRCKEKRVIVRRGSRDYLLLWRPWKGYVVRGYRPAVDRYSSPAWTWFEEV